MKTTLHRRFVFPLAFAALIQAGWVQAAVEVGHAVFARGAVTAQGAAGAVRILGKDAPLYEGDVLSTGDRSFAVLAFDDGTRMALRPDTVFSVQKYSRKPGEESALMRLFKGGLRAITGLIGKRRPDHFRLRTAVATIGIRGTEFDARLCTDDCRAEARGLKQTAAAPAAPVIGRVAYMRGSVVDRGAKGATRVLATGSAFFEGDTLITGREAFAVLVFDDRGRITLQADTEFRIERHRYDRKDPDRSSALFRLIKGGLRALSGLIAHSHPSAYRFATAVATIGIRGTGFDLACQGTCVSGAASPQAMRGVAGPLLAVFRLLIPEVWAALPSGNGLFAYVWKGVIEVDLDRGPVVVKEGQAAFFANGHTPARFLPEVPPFMRNNPAPRPDKVRIDFDRLLGTSRLRGVGPGLYVAFYKGEGYLLKNGERFDVGTGQGAYVSTQPGSSPVRLQAIPAFMSADPYLKTIDPRFTPLYDLLGNQPGSSECTIP